MKKIVKYSNSIICVFLACSYSPLAYADGMNALAIGAPFLVALLVIVVVVACVLYLLYRLIHGADNRNLNLEITLIILENKILISNSFYESQRDIQRLYDAYVSSVGPYEKEDMIDLLTKEFPDLEPSASKQVEFLQMRENSTASLLFKS